MSALACDVYLLHFLSGSSLRERNVLCRADCLFAVRLQSMRHWTHCRWRWYLHNAFKTPKYRMGKTFRMTCWEMNERKQKKILKEEKLDDIGGQWKGGPDNYSRTSSCCRSARKQPTLLFAVSKPCGFLDPELGFSRTSHGGCNQLE